MKLCLLFALPIALVTVSGCFSKPSPEEQKKQEDALAAALASAMTMPSSSTNITSGNAPVAATPGGISATCDNKGDGKCTETMGAAGFGADESCTKLGGVYSKGASPCSKDNMLGTCTRSDASSGLNDADYYYKQQGADADSLKSLCEGVMSGKWTAAPKSAAPAKASKGKK